MANANDWVPIKFSLAGYTALMTIVMTYAAQYTSNKSIETLGYLAAEFLHSHFWHFYS